MKLGLILATLATPALHCGLSGQAAETLSSWSNGPVKDAIVDFIARVMTKVNSDYVPPADHAPVIWDPQSYSLKRAWTTDGFFIPLDNGDMYVTGAFGPVRISKPK